MNVVLIFFCLLAAGCASSLSASKNEGDTNHDLGNQPSGALPSPTPAAPPQATPSPIGFNLKAQVEHYDQLYRLRDPYTKLVDNSGGGFQALYGARNVRTVLTGVYYRGGANNTNNSAGKRSNENPLQNNGVENLCEEGFSESIYLYDTNYSSAEHSAKCRTQSGTDSAIEYNQLTGLAKGNELKLLTRVHEHIKGLRQGPMYAHCWNGWHASGFVAAITLRQFCGWTGAEADAYWVKNTDGNSAGYDSIRNRITSFVPYAQLTITAAEKALICPATKIP